MELTGLLNLVIFGMILYIGFISIPTLMENKKANQFLSRKFKDKKTRLVERQVVNCVFKNGINLG